MNLLFVGDILPADRFYTQGFAVGTIFNVEGGSRWADPIQKLTETADFSMGNLEAPLISNSIDDPTIPFAGNTTFATYLKECGFDAVAIANNHILQHGSSGFLSTCKALNDVGVAFTGSVYNDDSNFRIVYSSGLTIAIMAFNAINDIANPGMYAELNQLEINKTLKEVKKHNADIIICNLHWGDEYVHIPSLKQIDLARSLIDAGINLVVGHHPHVVQPVERYKGGLIIYSLGNFLFGMNWAEKTRTGMAVKVKFIPGLPLDYEIIAVTMTRSFDLRIGDKQKWLKKTLREAELKMENLLHKGEQEYTRYYSKIVRRKRIESRIRSKIQLIWDWNKLHPEGKRILLSKLFSGLKRFKR